MVAGATNEIMVKIMVEIMVDDNLIIIKHPYRLKYRLEPYNRNHPVHTSSRL